jgi:ABC-type transport system involved in cytochrome c biogenesis permease subunit
VIKKFFHHVLPGVVKPMRVLWNEIIGFVFLAFAVWTVPSAYRHIRDFNGDSDSLFRLILTSLFSLIMIYFGVTSFLRARKISRS